MGLGFLVPALSALQWGSFKKRVGFSVKNGTYNKGDISYLAITGLIGIVIAIIFAGAFDIIVMGEPFDKIVIQVLGATIADVIVFFSSWIANYNRVS
ncbi:ECF transporter S component [Bacillus pacificus]